MEYIEEKIIIKVPNPHDEVIFYWGDNYYGSGAYATVIPKFITLRVSYNSKDNNFMCYINDIRLKERGTNFIQAKLICERSVTKYIYSLSHKWNEALTTRLEKNNEKSS